MRRTRSNTKRAKGDPDKKQSKKLKVQSVEEAPPEVQISDRLPAKRVRTDSSSSESDTGLIKAGDKINFSSLFQPTEVPRSFADVEKDIFAGVTKLSESESETEEPLEKTKVHFQKLHDYAQKIEEAKKSVALYAKTVKKRKETHQDEKTDKKLDILHMLMAAESKGIEMNEEDLHSSDFESLSESEKEDWEEVESQDVKKTENIIPKEGVQITVELPNDLKKKKKGLDLMAIMKRRLNRITKENQVYVHKVHLLCWLAHGFFINKILNTEGLLALALSLLPSQNCYPSGRTDLKYLEQVVKWYMGAIKVVEEPVSKDLTLEKYLRLQISKKEAGSKVMFVYLFICILRSLGIHCRLVLSFQVEPLRPRSADLLSLSEKSPSKKAKKISNELPSTSKGSEAIASTSQSISKSSHSSNRTSRSPDKNEPKSKLQNKESKKSSSSSKETIASTSKTLHSSRSPDKNQTKSKLQNTELRKSPGSSKETIASTSKTLHSSRSPDKNQTKSKLQNTELRKSPGSSKEAIASTSQSISKTLHLSKSPNKNETKLKLRNKEKLPSSSKEVVASTSQSTSNSLHSSGRPSRSPDKNEQTATSQSSHSKEVVTKNVATNSKTEKQRAKSVQRKPNYLKIKIPSRPKSTSEVEEKPPVIKKEPKTPKKPNLKRLKKVTIKLEVPQLDGANDSEDSVSKSKKPNLSKLKEPERQKCSKNHSRRLKSLPSYKEIDSEDDFEKENSPVKKRAKSVQRMDVRNDIINIIETRIAHERHTERAKLVKVGRRKNYDEDTPQRRKKRLDSEDDFRPETKVKRRVKVRPDENETEVKVKKGLDVWVEVFLEQEEKWISVDVTTGQLHCTNKLYSRASHPVSYVIAWNSDNSVKDITKRYCPNWNTVTRKLRTDSKWWEATLKPYRGPKTARDKEEDEDLARMQLEQPLPKTINEYKDHPLYVLKRHLLKFQGIYPPDAVTLGFVRNEPVYSRDCVHTLHSREIWVKHAKVVRAGEQPYKIVKSRPKYDRLTRTCISDLPLEIFGSWQVGDYVPPTAENGVVPRNAYGNVELFKPCMLPKGTVHLQLPGLNRVARKLNIDCASAVVGFDFHAGGSHPSFDGFIVCEEFADQLVAAWYVEQEEAEKREKEKIEKRIYGNWKKLIRGLLIRERLKARYDFGNVEKTKGGKKKGSKMIIKKQKVYSGSESD